MKSKFVKHGANRFKIYLKTAGKGYEVGFMHGSKSLFVGNFVNSGEAQTWFQMMDKEFHRFSKKFWVTGIKANAFYYKFITNNLYKHYYDYLDKCFGKYTRSYHKEFNRDVKVYNRMKKNWVHKDVHYSRRAA
jgi:hypothetical protein